MFPPVDEEMTWDDATTPPPLRQGTAEDVEEELVAALTPTKLFDTDDDSVDINDITSADSDDVFFDDSILEASINGRKRFSRSHPFRKQGCTRNEDKNTKVSDEEDNVDESNEEEDSHSEHLGDYMEDVQEEGIDQVDNTGQRLKSRRNVGRVNYALFHSKGRKK